MKYKTNYAVEAYIAINKNRIKVYRKDTKDDGVVYLNDKETFQIELFNPTQGDVLAVISLNDIKIDGGGIILKPGERVFLDRYLTENKKFMFSTYMASGTNEQLKHALENNGRVKVQFYKENVRPIYVPTHINTYTNSAKTTFTNFDNNIYIGLNNTSIGGNLYNSSGCLGSNGINCTDGLRGVSSVVNTSTSGNINLNYNSSKNIEVETGKIEKGGASTQEFVFVDKHFEVFPFTTISYTIQPISRKQSTVTDIQTVRRYCEQCGVKIAKQNAKFCWNCGSSL